MTIPDDSTGRPAVMAVDEESMLSYCPHYRLGAVGTVVGWSDDLHAAAVVQWGDSTVVTHTPPAMLRHAGRVSLPETMQLINRVADAVGDNDRIGYIDARHRAHLAGVTDEQIVDAYGYRASARMRAGMPPVAFGVEGEAS